ncbi:ribosomal L1 domain-containing protein 1-like [Solanum tuberosum]|uniref:Ribosomal L1 domain-containing protein 1 n=1 Tax=Solanum tuberosum TaxID=4113 RepID=M1CDD6_SOLTU|nr:PREDICTED: ribosomal L1 domain-containing protein 1-like [Solanum tuberosum]
MASTTMAKINEDQVRKAVKALLKWQKLQSKKTHEPQNLNSLSDEEENEEDGVVDDNFIYLQLTLKKIPPKELTTPHKITLPNPFFHPLESFANICLIIDDRPRKPHNSKTKLDVETVLKKLKSEGISITKVLKFTKLKSEYKSFDSKLDLYGSYELFLADKRVMNLLPGLLGKQFYKKKRKVPVPVDLRGNSSWKEEIERACSSTLLCLGSGTCSVLKIGRGGMENGEVMENVLAAIDGIVEFVPKKLNGVRAFHLKFSDSLALPVYEDLPDQSANTEKKKK